MVNSDSSIPAIAHPGSHEAQETMEGNFPRSEHASVHGPMGNERHAQSLSQNAPAPEENEPRVDTNVLLAQALQQLTQQMASGSGKARSSSYTDFLNLKPPAFPGTTNPAVAEEWLKKMERIFQIMRRDISDEEKVDFATYMLQDEALNWWQSLQLRDLGGRAWSWDLFRSEFLKKYFPDTVRYQLQR